MQLIIGLIGLVIAVIGIMDVAKSSLSGEKKALWIILILIFPIIGFVLYWFLGRKKSS